MYETKIDGLDLLEAGKEDQNSVGGLSLNTNRKPSNLPKGFQRFGFENHFRAGDFSDLG